MDRKEMSIYRLIGIWDFIITLPFLIPKLNIYLLSLFEQINGIVSPDRIFTSFSSIHILFVQLFGFMCVLWAIVRIHKPQKILALYDFIGRIIVSVILITFYLYGGSLVPVIFVLSELGFGILEGIVLIKNRKLF
jgi:hypothetical protein